MIRLIPPSGTFLKVYQIRQPLMSLGRSNFTSSSRLASSALVSHQSRVCADDLKRQVAATCRSFSQCHVSRRSMGDSKSQRGAIYGQQMSHTSFGIPGLETEEGDVKHTPIFSQAVLVRIIQWRSDYQTSIELGFSFLHTQPRRWAVTSFCMQ